MALSPELTLLFERLASRLQTLDYDEGQNRGESSLQHSIPQISESLNLSDGPGVGVLDAALSLLCFRSPLVFDSVVEYLVRTIVATLSSSVTCKSFRLQNEETLKVGSSVSCRDWVKLADILGNAIRKLMTDGESSGTPGRLLLHAVLRVGVSISTYQYMLPYGPVYDPNLIQGRSTAIAMLRRHLPAELFLDSHEIPLRTLFWYLDPILLKDDVSKILQGIFQRPFLNLKKELYERVEWRNIVICLVLSPTMFIETRALLHNWFLMKGLSSILELLTGLISAALELISIPTSWGIPMKLASKLPFSSAYFPCKLQLLRIFAGPLYPEGLLHLVHNLSEDSNTASGLTSRKSSAVHHKSEWALALNFPEWFYFASVLLFSEGEFLEQFQLKCTVEATDTWRPRSEEALSKAASRYIAWFMSPTDTTVQSSLVKSLAEMMEAWSLKHSGSGSHLACSQKKREKLGSQGKKDGFTLSKIYDYKMIELLLQDFENSCVQHVVSNASIACKATRPNGVSRQQGLLIRRVLLGILIGCPDMTTEKGCEVLLHYAATGRIISSSQIKNTLQHRKQYAEEKEDAILQSGEWTKSEALAGARIVYSLTDIVEGMFSLFETEEKGLECICCLKLNCSRYLIKCINKLIQLDMNEDKGMLLVDLRNRLRQWRQQGREVSQLSKVLDDIDVRLGRRVSLP